MFMRNLVGDEAEICEAEKALLEEDEEGDAEAEGPEAEAEEAEGGD